MAKYYIVCMLSGKPRWWYYKSCLQARAGLVVGEIGHHLYTKEEGLKAFYEIIKDFGGNPGYSFEEYEGNGLSNRYCIVDYYDKKYDANGKRVGVSRSRECNLTDIDAISHNEFVYRNVFILQELDTDFPFRF